MFKNKRVKTTKKPYVVELKVVDPSVHVMDVNVTITKSKVTEKKMFKDREPINKKFVVDWEKE
jgi:hypothetical protein